MKHLYLPVFLFLLSIQDINSQCLYSADYYTYNNFCDLDSLYLTAHPLNGTGPYTYLWATGDTTQTISIPLALGDYLVTITDSEGCSIVINCHVKPYPQVLFYPFNQNACFGDTVTLFLDWFRDSIPGATYLWSTGETTSSILITDDITWSATVTDPNTGCEYVIPPSFFDFHPTPYPEIIGPDVLCSGQTIILTVEGGPFGTLIWFPSGIYDDSLEVVWPGVYTVWGSSPEAGYCWHQDSIIITEAEINPPMLSGPPELCDGASGTISIDNSNEYTTFLWSNNQTTSFIPVTQSGTYTVTVTNDGGCTASASFTIEPGNLNITITGSISPSSSCVQPNGAVDLSVSPTGPYTYDWSNGSSTQDINNLSPGTYTVTVTDNGGCSSTAGFLVDDTTSPPSPVATPMSSTCEQSNGAIDLTVSPSGAYTYIWSNGETTQDLINIMAGSYSVTVTSTANGCSSDMTIVVLNNNPPITITGNTTPVTSCTTPNGAIDISLSPTGTYTYLWSNGGTTEDLSNLSFGIYTVTVSAGGNCIENAVYTIENNPMSPVLTLSPMSATCGQSNGAVDLSVSPAGTYTYLWSTGATSEDLTTLSSGTYSVTVTDILTSCTSTADITLTDDQIMIDITGTTLPNTLCQGANGAVDISINPPGAYTFLWSNGQTTEDITSLPAGSYTVSATLGFTCTQTAIFEVTEMTEPILISGNITANTSCTQPNGAIDISVAPSGTYSFVWSNGEVTEDISQLPGGHYGITVTDNNGCTSSGAFDIMNTNSNYTFEAVVTPNTACSSPDGKIDLILSPPGTYTFLWTNGLITEDINMLSAGSYGVTVTDIHNCTAVATYAITDSLLLPAISAQTSPESCGNQDGSIDVTVMPGNGNVFIWSTGSTNEDINNLSAGVYSLTVTASNGCTAAESFSVLNQNSNFISSGSVTPNSSCILPNGAIDLTVSPPGAYTFTWSNGATTEDLNNLSSGTYTVQITDLTLCSSTETFVITANTSDIIIASVITPSSCGLNNGTIEITINPPAGNTYIWSNGETTEDIQDLSSGLYILTVTGTSGCTSVDTFVVYDQGLPITLQGMTSANTECITANGTIDLAVYPNGAYSYLWSTGNTTQDLGSLAPGTYTVTVSDMNGCSSTASFSVDDQTFRPVIQSTIIPSNCGHTNGQIDLAILPTGSYLYTWSNGATSEDLTALAPGMYSVTVSGPGGCTSDTILEVVNTGLTFTLSATITGNTSCTGADGSIELTVSPTGNYSFIWSNGEITEDLTNISPGIYSVSVTDQSGCSTAGQYVIDNNITPLMVEDIITPVLCGDPNGSIDLDVTPNSGNTFIWSTGSTSEDLDDLLPGMYSVTITATSGCTWTSAFNVEGNEKLEITLEADVIQSGSDLITIRAEINLPVSALDSLIWLPEALFNCSQQICLEQTINRPASQTEITVMAVDTNGCMVQTRLALEDIAEPEVYIPNVFSPNTDGINDMFTIYGNKDVAMIEQLQIFDRWGNQVFTKNEFPPNEERFGWDGTFRNEAMNPAVFVYWARVRYTDGRKGSFKGDITLIR